MNLKGRNFLTLKDFTPEEILCFLDRAEELKQQKKAGIAHQNHPGKNIALIFEKTSTRTRCSFEVAAHDLGMHVTYLDPTGSQIGKKESIADTARVLGRMYDGIEYRGYGQNIVEELAKEGIEVCDQTLLIRPLMPEKGTLTKREPTEAELKDMEFGFRMAKEIGRLDVGQTAVVKDLAVMALEAIEGTDACIDRGGKLSRGGAVVVKVAKPEQDLRFDVPAVGVTTIEHMAAVGAKALAIEAGHTLLVDREEVIALAEKNKITIVAM